MLDSKSFLSMVALAIGLLSPAVSWASVTRTCFAVADDVDRDGYARTGAAGSMRQSPSGNDLECPSGFVRFAGDCDDNNAQTHPRRGEIPNNAVDDNCRDGADEPEFVYSPFGPFTTANSFEVRVRSNHSIDEDLADGLQGLVIFFDVEYAPLTNTNAVQRTPAKFFTGLNAFNATSHTFSIGTVTGLTPETVYRARVRFYLTDLVSTVIEMRKSAWFHTMLPGTTSSDAADLARYRIVQRAIFEARSSDLGEVGYRGTSARDGRRYGASTGEQWCSEFYSWVAAPNMPGISGADSTSEIKDFFEDNRAWFSGSSSAFAGEYLGLDTDTDGKKNHSAMVLGWDQAKSAYWTLEGNFNNSVGITTRKRDAQILGVGGIYADMVR